MVVVVFSIAEVEAGVLASDTLVVVVTKTSPEPSTDDTVVSCPVEVLATSSVIIEVKVVVFEIDVLVVNGCSAVVKTAGQLLDKNTHEGPEHNWRNALLVDVAPKLVPTTHFPTLLQNPQASSWVHAWHPCSNGQISVVVTVESTDVDVEVVVRVVVGIRISHCPPPNPGKH